MTVNSLAGPLLTRGVGAASKAAARPVAKPVVEPVRLEASLAVQGGLPTASLIGELNGETAAFLERLVDDLAAQGESRVVLDLGQLFSVDLAGVAALRDAAALLRECGGWLSLAALRPRVRYFLARTGAAAHFATYRSVDDAVRDAEACVGADAPGGTADELRQPVGSATRPVMPALVSTLTRR
ncbi:MAG TPA: STAS domain-containing protein [Actinocrinis sp.]|nr:STAS domain-containing protein [Actinocrinis sp.]